MEKTERKFVSDTKYEIVQDVNVDGTHYIFAVDENADNNMRFFVGEANYCDLFICYENNTISDDYIEAMSEWTSRLCKAVKRCSESLEKIKKDGVKLTTLSFDDVDTSIQDYKNKVVVIKPSSIIYESQYAHCQLAFVTNGNGCSPRSMGTAVYCDSIYTGESARWERNDILGVIRTDRVPEWAKKKVAELQKKYSEAITADVNDKEV